jgi:hypothetical protein
MNRLPWSPTTGIFQPSGLAKRLLPVPRCTISHEANVAKSSFKLSDITPRSGDMQYSHLINDIVISDAPKHPIAGLPMAVLFTAIVLLNASLSACATDVTPADGFAVYDSAGIHIVENAGPMWSEISAWTLAAEPSVEIGADQADSTQHLFGVTGAERLGDGRIVIANSGTKELRVFDVRGAFVQAVGRSGDGPGEFGTLHRLYRCGKDSLAVDELRRVSHFDAQGHFVRTEHIGRRPGDGIQHMEAISADCAAILVLDREPLVPPFGRGIFHQKQTLYWTATDGKRDTIASFPGRERVTVTLPGFGAAPAPLPWGKEPVWTTDGEVVYLGMADDFEVRAFDRHGALRTIIRWAAERQPVTRADRALFAERREAFLEKNPGEARLTPELAAYPTLPMEKPAYSRLLLDDEGNLWVRQYPRSETGTPGAPLPRRDENPESWWVFDPSGRLLGTIRIPSALKVLAIRGGHVVALWLDQDEVERVRLYPLQQRDR